METVNPRAAAHTGWQTLHPIGLLAFDSLSPRTFGPDAKREIRN
jgi:hypothetical protein